MKDKVTTAQVPATDETARNTAVLQLTRYLENRGMRKTPERYAILEQVLASTGHFTIDLLTHKIESDGYRVSRATVYNTVNLFCDIGITRRRNFGNGAIYERNAGPNGHHHLVCSVCGQVHEIKDQTLDKMLTDRRYGTFQPIYSDIYIYGLCGKCSRRSKRGVIQGKTTKNKEPKNIPISHNKK